MFPVLFTRAHKRHPSVVLVLDPPELSAPAPHHFRRLTFCSFMRHIEVWLSVATLTGWMTYMILKMKSDLLRQSILPCIFHFLLPFLLVSLLQPFYHNTTRKYMQPRILWSPVSNPYPPPQPDPANKSNAGLVPISKAQPQGLFSRKPPFAPADSRGCRYFLGCAAVLAAFLLIFQSISLPLRLKGGPLLRI